MSVGVLGGLNVTESSPQSSWQGEIGQPFTVSAPITVTRLELEAGSPGLTVGERLGIGTQAAMLNNDRIFSSPPLLQSGVIDSSTTIGSWGGTNLTALTLQPGTTYMVYYNGQGAAADQASTLKSVVDSAPPVYNPYGQTGSHLPFRLIGAVADTGSIVGGVGVNDYNDQFYFAGPVGQEFVLNQDLIVTAVSFMVSTQAPISGAHVQISNEFGSTDSSYSLVANPPALAAGTTAGTVSYPDFAMVTFDQPVHLYSGYTYLLIVKDATTAIGTAPGTLTPAVTQAQRIVYPGGSLVNSNYIPIRLYGYPAAGAGSADVIGVTAVMPIIILPGRVDTATPQASRVSDTVAGAQPLPAGTQVSWDSTKLSPVENGFYAGYWTWTAPSTQTVEFNTVASSFDTTLALFTVSSAGPPAGPSDLQQLNYDDDGGGNATSRLQQAVTAGTVYYVRVQGFDPSYNGHVILNYPDPGGGRPFLAGGTAQIRATSTPGAVSTLRAGEVRLSGLSALLTLNARSGAVVVRPSTRVLGVTTSLAVLAPAGDLDVWQLDRTANVLTVTVYTPLVYVQPGSLRISLGNGAPSSVVHLFIDGIEVIATTLDATGAVNEFYVPVNGLVSGTHDLSASPTTTPPDSGVLFTCITDALSVTVDSPPPPPGAAPVNFWTFTDYYRNLYGLFDSYTLPRNPETVQQKLGTSAVASDPVAAGGHIVSWEGAGPPPQWTITGRCFTDVEYDAMVAWGQGNRRVYITDHHGDRFLVVMNGLSTERVRDTARRWHTKYTLTFTAVAGPGIT